MKTFENIGQIRAEREIQRKDPVIYSLLGVVLGELDRLPIPRGQEPSEDQIYTVIKKLYEAAKEMRAYSPESEQEYMYLKDYIKVQLTEEEITNIIKNLISVPNTNIGVIMKYFKDTYPGRYDGKLVSRLAKIL